MPVPFSTVTVTVLGLNAVVAYMPGAANRRDAEQVASSLKLSANSVQPIDQGTQQIACAQSQPCTANVVVTVGADLEPGQ